MTTKNDDLISRAAAIEYLMTNMGWHDEDGYEVDDADEKRAIITDLVNGIPAVDAVPVEWLRNRRDIYLKAYHAGHESELHIAAILNDTLQAWQKEQEAQDG